MNSGTRLRVGIACWPTYGGSGIVATEIGHSLAARGHRVHVIASAVPSRLDREAPGVTFHEVVVRDYPLLEHGTFPLALASKLVEVIRRERLDLIHVHYAVPHATAAWLAQKILEQDGQSAPPIVTTLHGTDVTLVGCDPSFLPVARFSILASQAVTAPSEFLREATYEQMSIPRSLPIEVIPNFVDAERFMPVERGMAALAAVVPFEWLKKQGTERPRILVHDSNFRALKRVDLVVRIFAEVRRRSSDALLVLVGDGPERAGVEALVDELGVRDSVCFLGEQRKVAEILAQADLFLLPSETESFGLAALEAQSCGVPVIASRVGGLPEVIEDGVTGLLCPVGDVGAMADAALSLLTNEARRQAMSEAARGRAVERFAREPMVDRYEAVYRRTLDAWGMLGMR